MEKLRARFELHFSTKVIVPLVALMGLLMLTTVKLLDLRVTQQFQLEATRSLAAADSFFRGVQKTHAQELVLRYRNLPKEPRYQAQFQSGDPPTLRNWFEQDLLGEQKVDLIFYVNERGESVASAQRDPLISCSEFEMKCADALKHAWQRETITDMVEVGGRLFEVVAIPVLVGSNDNPIGVLTFGLELGNAAADQLRNVAQCQVVLLANGRVVVSTKPAPELNREFIELYTAQAGPRMQRDFSSKGILLGDEHYFCSAGRFESLGKENDLGYLLLLSYEKRLAALHGTQQMLVGVTGIGTLIGAIVVWLLVRKLTAPLRELRDSAEAVGKGDYTQRVEVKSRDECGELASVFNQMTENVARSRAELESTVQTLKATQAQLIQSEKLSGIGEFVAGVAHELNNPLTSVMGFSELLGRADTDPQRKRYLEMILKSAQRCHKIVQGLLSFARRHQPERKLSNLNDLIEGAVEFLAYQLRTSNVEVLNKISTKLPPTMVDPHQIQQVFLNIINNARQAIEAHQRKGSITLSSEVSGAHVRVILRDDGPGIPEGNLSKVFDPFFTTKEPGKGTGLGLSLCYGIIKEHGGTIVVRSKPGEGATFIIELPVAPDGPTSQNQPEDTDFTHAVPNALEGAGRRILIIDDEEQILQMLKETLSAEGYQVDVAQDGETALECIRHTSYDLALCDWRMPGLNGEQVYERARVFDPELCEKMIFLTGDVINQKVQQFLKDHQKHCLPKPFSLHEFRRAVRGAISSQDGTN